MKIKTSELIAPALDWAVAQCEIIREDWKCASKENISWKGVGNPCHGYGPTPLIAAMRGHVASKLGDEVEVPEELMGRR